ncbi:MAG TPA: ABC transporter permease [Chryseosolibacter sp.]|nr:ABC transporter permease [Chryseosolibacter sp.]
MIKNYFTVALRQLLKNKTFSLINILGLSTGIACCLLLALYIQDEFSYEKHFPGYDRVYRLCTTFYRDGQPKSFPRTSPPIAMDLLDELPQIESATRVVNPPEVEVHLIYHGENVFYEKSGVLVDSTFLRVFPYTLKEGDANTALDAPASILLSEKLANKIFRDKSPLDELLIVNSGRAADTFRVTGVIKATAFHSHVDADFYMNMNSDGWGEWVMGQTTWAWNNLAAGYIKLKEGTDPAEINSKFPELIEKYAGADLKNAGIRKEMFVQPLEQVRLYSDFSDSFGNTGSGGITYIYILGSIGLFILLLACINFMNLTTAKASQRAGEVGIRKSMGAYRSNLIFQFIGESMIIVFVSLMISLLICTLVLPIINEVTDKTLGINSTNVGFIFAALAAIGIITGLAAGSYPAFFLSSFEPVKVLKSKNLSSDGSQWIRKALVSFQFVITICLVSSILIIHKQITYINNKPLGFDHEQVIMIPLRTEQAANNFVSLKNRFEQISGIQSVSGTTSLPSTTLFRDFALYTPGSTMDKAAMHRVVNVDEDYFKTLNIRLLKGRDFNAATDTFSYVATDNKVIVNQASLREFNIDEDEAIGYELLTDWRGTTRRHKIIGVVEDFHQFSLHQPIAPLLFLVPPGRSEYVFLTASVSSADMNSIHDQMKTSWQSIVTDAPFEFEYLGESVAKQYESESKMSMMLSWSASIAIVICCLGLYGLSVYVAERRVKEIGIRKVLGASVTTIVKMLSLDFIKLIIIAFVIATPIGYYMMDKWLSSFAYKVEPGIFIFILSGIITFSIAWLTIGFESMKAASGNPVKALRSE